MNYDAAVRYLLTLGRELAAPTQAAAAKFDLENINVLAERLGRPDRAYPSAHIAGTNGKGSTAAFLESILRRAGFRTGLNTSPHLERINERIRVNGEEISDAGFAVTLTRIQKVIEDAHSESDRGAARRGEAAGASHVFRMRDGHGFRIFFPGGSGVRGV